LVGYYIFIFKKNTSIFQVGLSRRTTEKTRLTYLTTGVLLQTLITKRSLGDYTHIIIDEVHERDLDTDLLLLVIKKLMVEKEDRKTKIVLMSATLNADKFAEYFPKWKYMDETATAGIVRIPLTCNYKVEEYYLDTVCHLLVGSLLRNFQCACNGNSLS
jgi:ATP-dependent RNA helicase TDRD9